MAIQLIGTPTTAGGQSSLTLAVPTGYTSGDLLLVFAESANETISITTSGWTQIGSQASQGTGTAAAANATRVACFYKWATASESSISIADSGDHTVGCMTCWRGVSSWETPVSGINATATASCSCPAITTTINGSCVINTIATDYDGASTTRFSSWANTDLASITEICDYTISNQDGGGLGIAYGLDTVAGSVKSTTVTSAGSEEHGYITIALKPTQQLTKILTTGVNVVSNIALKRITKKTLTTSILTANTKSNKLSYKKALTTSINLTASVPSKSTEEIGYHIERKAYLAGVSGWLSVGEDAWTDMAETFYAGRSETYKVILKGDQAAGFGGCIVYSNTEPFVVQYDAADPVNYASIHLLNGGSFSYQYIDRTWDNGWIPVLGASGTNTQISSIRYDSTLYMRLFTANHEVWMTNYNGGSIGGDYVMSYFGTNGSEWAEIAVDDASPYEDSLTLVDGVTYTYRIRQFINNAYTDYSNESSVVYRANSVYSKTLTAGILTSVKTNPTTDLTGKTLTLSGGAAVTYDATEARNVIAMDGSSTYGTFADSDDWAIGINDYCVEVFVKRSELSNLVENRILGITDNAKTQATRAFHLAFNGYDSVQFVVFDSSSYRIAASASYYDDDLTSIHHIAGVKHGDTLYVYYDGVMAGTGDCADFTINNSTYPLTIGRMGDWDAEYFHGGLYGLRITKGSARYPSGTTFTPPSAFIIDSSEVVACTNFDSAGLNKVKIPYVPSAEFNLLDVNIGNTWKATEYTKVNIDGAWKSIEYIKVNIGGSWKDLIN